MLWSNGCEHPGNTYALCVWGRSRWRSSMWKFSCAVCFEVPQKKKKKGPWPNPSPGEKPRGLSGQSLRQLPQDRGASGRMPLQGAGLLDGSARLPAFLGNDSCRYCCCPGQRQHHAQEKQQLGPTRTETCYWFRYPVLLAEIQAASENKDSRS